MDALEGARGLVLAGDMDALGSLLAAESEVLAARWPGTEAPYDGYFHGATLLHHVAANPFIAELPPNIVDVAALLLDAGAEVDAPTLAGPSQPDDIGWTALGLVATSAEARRAGSQGALLGLLLARGADPDARNGGCVMGALYYGETAAAERLAEAGAGLDLPAAAGVGDIERLADLLAASPEEVAAARTLVHYSRVRWPTDESVEVLRLHVLGMGLVYAALHGRTEALRMLMAAGADPDHRPPFEHGATPLHWAVVGDRPESVRALLEAGADPTLRDRDFDATPAGWAEHLGRSRAAAELD